MRAERVLWAIGRSVAMAAIVACTAGAGRADEPKAYTEKLSYKKADLFEMEFVPIPGGSITLDDPAKPGTKVTVTIKPCWMSKTEVLWEQYDSWLFRADLDDKAVAKGVDAENRPSTPYVPPDRGFGHDGWPVISTSYLNATKYCAWLSKFTGKKYRLPTEAEWQYAALAGQPEEKLTPQVLDKIAWYVDNAENKTHEAGKKDPNAWGLFDMLGNAREWCVGLDGNPVTKGGGFDDKAEGLQPSARILPVPEWQKTDPQRPKSKWWLSDAPWGGFRVIRDAD